MKNVDSTLIKISDLANINFTENDEIINQTIVYNASRTNWNWLGAAFVSVDVFVIDFANSQPKYEEILVQLYNYQRKRRHWYQILGMCFGFLIIPIFICGKSSKNFVSYVENNGLKRFAGQFFPVYIDKENHEIITPVKNSFVGFAFNYEINPILRTLFPKKYLSFSNNVVDVYKISANY